MIKFTATRTEFLTIVSIAQRYEALCTRFGREAPRRQDLLLDLEAVHCNGCPLDLVALYEASDDVSFLHDVGGIGHNVNRETGKLENCFVPRYARWSNASERAFVERAAERRALVSEPYRWPETDRRKAEQDRRRT